MPFIMWIVFSVSHQTHPFKHNYTAHKYKIHKKGFAKLQKQLSKTFFMYFKIMILQKNKSHDIIISAGIPGCPMLKFKIAYKSHNSHKPSCRMFYGVCERCKTITYTHRRTCYCSRLSLLYSCCYFKGCVCVACP